MIYFIAGGKYVKIGFTRGSIYKRLGGIQACCPLELRIVGLFQGDRRDERRYHEQFSEYHLRGEWHLFSPEIEEFLTSAENILNHCEADDNFDLAWTI